MIDLAPDPRMLARRAQELLNTGRTKAAKPLVAALRRIEPDAPDSLELEARLLTREGRIADAEALLDAALISLPDCSRLLLCRAEVRIQQGALLGGADDAAAAVIAAPDHAPAKAVLGIALIELGRFGEAVICLREAIDTAPGRPDFWEALAQALERGGDAEAARQALERAVATMPGSISLRVAAIMTAMRQQNPLAAARLAEAARAAGVADARVFGLLGHARSLLGEMDAAALAYDDALKLAPEDPYVRFLVSSSGLRPSAPRAPSAYVATVFDGYAGHFDAHLISLGYRVPGLIRRALLERLPSLRQGRPAGPVLDLGCGTGLIGVVLSDLPVTGLVGVDISSKMLDQARGKNVYAELIHQDIEAALSVGGDGASTGATASSWAIIIAADSLCYFGDLRGIFAAAFMALRPGGLFLLSLEEFTAPPNQDGADEDGGGLAAGWRLGPLGRYAHRADAVQTLAQEAGFVTEAPRREVLRNENGIEVRGLIVVLSRPR